MQIKDFKIIYEKFRASTIFYHLNKIKEIQPIHSKGDQSWLFFGRTDA